MDAVQRGSLAEVLEGLIGSGRPHPTKEEMREMLLEEVEDLKKMFADDSIESKAARAYIDGFWIYCEGTYALDQPLSRILAATLNHVSKHMMEAFDELKSIGRLRADAIKAATGVDPCPPRPPKAAKADGHPEGWEEAVRPAA